MKDTIIGNSVSASEPWLTVNELMIKLQVSRTTVYRWTKMGVLPAYRLPLSRNVYYRGSEVDAFIKLNPVAPSGRLDKLGLGLASFNDVEQANFGSKFVKSASETT